MKHLFKASLVGASAILLAGCGGGDSNDAREKQMEDAAARQGIDADVTLDEKGEPAKIEIKQGGGTVGQGLDLPSGFPDDINLPGDWNVIAVTAPMPNAHSIQALSPETTEALLEDIRARLSGQGWTETAADSPTPAMSRIGFEKEGRMANFNIIENGETRAVQLVTMPKP